MAQIALVCVAVPAGLVRNIVIVLFRAPCELLVGYQAGGVPRMDNLVDRLAI